MEHIHTYLKKNPLLLFAYIHKFKVRMNIYRNITYIFMVTYFCDENYN